MEIKRCRIKVFGLVQGVWFRKYTKEAADKLYIKGFCKNMPDKSVYIEAEGNENAINNFITWCSIGSPLSKVRDLQVDELEFLGDAEFKIV
jgi:acylphosphatase